MARRQADWFAVGVDAWLLGFEVARVVWLRSWLIALGGARAEHEARRMIEEKLAAQGRTPAQSTLAEMDRLWDEAKAEERSG